MPDSKEERMKQRVALMCTVATCVCLLVAGCAKQSFVPTLEPPGFWMGLLHGIIMPFSLVGSLFTDCRIYAFPNSGFWYDLGFFIGVGGLGCGGGAACKRPKR
jgi:hypothetical protein